jgi:hypothetical protein
MKPALFATALLLTASAATAGEPVHLTPDQMDQVTAGALDLAYAPGLTNVLIPIDPYAPGARTVFGELPPNPVLPPGVAGRFGGSCTRDVCGGEFPSGIDTVFP